MRSDEMLRDPPNPPPPPAPHRDPAPLCLEAFLISSELARNGFGAASDPCHRCSGNKGARAGRLRALVSPRAAGRRGGRAGPGQQIFDKRHRNCHVTPAIPLRCWLYAVQGDYHIAMGIDANHAIDNRKYFYSTDLQSWGLLPRGKSKYKQLCLLTTAPFRGDPGLKIKVLDESLVEGDPDRCKEMIEEKRLAATVALIGEEAEVCARGQLLKDPTGNVTINQHFYGLTLAEAKELKSYLHVRTPINRWNTNLLTRSDYNYSFDFLDSVDMDIPSGCWNLSVKQSDGVVYLKNLYWPGMSYFHIIKTADAGFFYVVDVGSMVDDASTDSFRQFSSALIDSQRRPKLRKRPWSVRHQIKLHRVRPDGTCECRRRVTCAMDDAWWKSSRHRMSQETVTGRFPSLLPGRRRLERLAIVATYIPIDRSRIQNKIDAALTEWRDNKLVKQAAFKKKTAAEYDGFPLSYTKKLIRAASLEKWQKGYAERDTGEVIKCFFP
ncbi:Radial spoke head protein 9 homolog [Eumeta japonica]|uniref:Radial spoke head protein 9 homolog n=1 Tax=Eumeta variegata TaxID=151549 RepID=A0A4C1ZLY4_EUMVA|nr:Radial spoke head protein 9 homolog [Eumeta japonica]